MSYRDVVISHRPSFYVPLDEFATPKADISGQGTGTFSPALEERGVVPRALVTSASGNVSSNTRIAHQDYQDLPFTIDLWCSPEFSSIQGGTLFTIGTNVVIFLEQNRAYFRVRGADGINRYAYQDIDDMDQPIHLTAIFSIKAIVMFVNGVPGTVQTIPEDFTWTGTTTSHELGLRVSHVAVFTRVSTLDEIVEREVAGRTYHSFEDTCEADGGIYWDASNTTDPLLSEMVIDAEDWGSGQFFNCYADEYGRLITPEQSALGVYDSTQTAVTASFTSSRLNLGSATRHAMRPTTNALSASGFAIVGYVRGAVGGADRWVYTILNGKTGEAWAWKVTSAGVAKLVHRTLDSGTETLTEYTYDTTVATDSYFIVHYDNGAITLYTGTVNPVSGSNTIEVPIQVLNDSQIIFGANWDRAGDGVQQLDYLYLYNYAPDMAALGGNYTSLVSTTLSSVYYPLDTNADNYTKATWTYDLQYPVLGQYKTHSVVWNGMRNSTYATYEINYNSLGYETLTWGRKIPDLPTNSEIGGSGQVTGPLVLRISLNAIGRINPYVKSVTFRIYTTDSYKSTNSSFTAVSEAYNVANSGRKVPTYMNLAMPAREIISADRITHDVDFGVKTVEAVVRVLTGDVGEVICLDNNTIPATKNISFNGTQLVNNGFDTMYVNGVSVTSPFTVTQNRNLHIVGVSATAIDSDIVLGNHYTGTITTNDTRLDIYGVAAYDKELTAAQVAIHYQASRGWVVNQPTEYDSISFVEGKRARGYTYAWETAGDTT